MDYRPVDRPRDAFQQPVPPDALRAMARRAFGAGTEVVSATELSAGSYNTTLRVRLAGRERPVILRVAPEPGRQYRSEREFLRNEYLCAPYLAPIAAMLPRTLAADFTHDLIGRDWAFQTLLDGVPAHEGLNAYAPELHHSFYRGIGTVARTLHAVRGPGFGPANGPLHATWSAALARAFEDIAADLAGAGLDPGPAHRAAAETRRQHALLDAVTEPRLLHGDLWTVNLMLAAGAPEPVITGVLDCDRVWWGDPAADWTLHILATPGRNPARESFWETYGPPDTSPQALRRARFYRARHAGAIALEAARLGRDGLPGALTGLAAAVDALTEA